jgi:hypothetical protein
MLEVLYVIVFLSISCTLFLYSYTSHKWAKHPLFLIIGVPACLAIAMATAEPASIRIHSALKWLFVMGSPSHPIGPGRVNLPGNPLPVSRDPQFTCDTPPLISRLSGRQALNKAAVDDCIDRAGICRNVLRALCSSGAHGDPLNVCIRQTRNLLGAADVQAVADLLSTRKDCAEELGIWLEN